MADTNRSLAWFTDRIREGKLTPRKKTIEDLVRPSEKTKGGKSGKAGKK